MVDALKEGVTLWVERVKSPIAGSIILSFAAVNWQPIWFVVWSEVDATERFLYFDEHTSPQSLYLWPILIGFLLGILGPWLRWFGAFTANYPTKKYREIEDKQASDLRLAAMERDISEQRKREELQTASEQAELAAAKAEEAADQRKIARAKRAESAESLDNGAAAEAIRSSFELENTQSLESWKREYVDNLSPVRREVIRFLGNQNNEVNMNSVHETADLIKWLARSNPEYTQFRIETLIDNEYRALLSDNIVGLGNRGQRLTRLGYEIFDLINQSAP